MRRWCVLVAAALVLAIPCQPQAEAGIWGAIKRGARSVKNAAVGVASAPFRLAGEVVGPGVKAAFDPAMDGAFARAQTLTDHAAERFRGVLDEQTTKIDKVAEKRLDQLDQIMGKNLVQVDEVLDKRLQQFDVIAINLLDQQAQILDSSLTRVDLILQQNITEVGVIADRSLDRLEGLQDDTFDRLAATLQDQVPVAASRVGREMVWVAITIIFLVVLVGGVGTQFVRRFMEDRKHDPSLSLFSQFRANAKAVPHMLAVVGIPLAGLTLLVAVGYISWYRTAESNRISHLAAAAVEFEKAGDFKSAASIRRRVAVLSLTPEATYSAERARFLADFSQDTLQADWTILARRLRVLRETFPKLAETDAEIEAASIYLTAQVAQLGDTFDLASLTTKLDSYETTHFAKLRSELQAITPDASTASVKQLQVRAKAPTLGKLVLVTKYRAALNAAGSTLHQRLDAAIEVLDSTIELYPSYPAARAARANLSEIRRQSALYVPPGNGGLPQPQDTDTRIKQDVDVVTSQAPELAQILRIRLVELPSDLAKTLQTKWQLKAEERAKDQEFLTASAQLDAFTQELVNLALPVYGHPALAKIEVERVVNRAIARDTGLIELRTLKDSAVQAILGEPDTKKKYAACLAVAKRAEALGEPIVAEAWYLRAKDIAEQSAKAFEAELKDLTTTLDSLQDTLLSARYLTVL